MFRVLLPVAADEERALTAAEVVTTLPDAAETVQVTILNVQNEMDVADDDGHRRISSEDLFDETDFPQSAKEAKEYLKNAGIAVEMRREHADPKEAIVEIATEIDADRIVMAGRNRSPTGKVLFGSVTQAVLLSSDVPVTAVMS